GRRSRDSFPTLGRVFSNGNAVAYFGEAAASMARTQDEGAPAAVRQGRGRGQRRRWPAKCQRICGGGHEVTEGFATTKRVVIEDVTPRVDEGRFPAKRIVGDVVTVEADVFVDGHDRVAAMVRYK